MQAEEARQEAGLREMRNAQRVAEEADRREAEIAAQAAARASASAYARPQVQCSSSKAAGKKQDRSGQGKR